MEQKPGGIKRQHLITVDSRKKGSITGVNEVISYTESQLYLKTSEGDLLLTGRQLKIVKYSTDEGTLSFTGEVDALRYPGQKVPLRKRLFQ